MQKAKFKSYSSTRIFFNGQGGQSPREILASAVLMTTLKESLRAYQYFRMKDNVKRQIEHGGNPVRLVIQAGFVSLGQCQRKRRTLEKRRGIVSVDYSKHFVEN